MALTIVYDENGNVAAVFEEKAAAEELIEQAAQRGDVLSLTNPRADGDSAW